MDNDTDNNTTIKTTILPLSQQEREVTLHRTEGNENYPRGESSAAPSSDEDEYRTTSRQMNEGTSRYVNSSFSSRSLLPMNPLLLTSRHKKRTRIEVPARGTQSAFGTQSTESRGGNVVTSNQNSTTTSSATATTTSDDRDSSGTNGEHCERIYSSLRNESGSGSNTRGSPSALQETCSHYPHYHHHYHHQKMKSGKGDGSDLQVPGDDGSERLATHFFGGEGIVQPATVVASRYNATNASSTTSSSGGEGDSQHEHLLPPHREPGYHTIRRTLNQFPKGRASEDANTKGRAVINNSSTTTTDSSSSMERIAETRGNGTAASKKKKSNTRNRKRKWKVTDFPTRNSSSPSADTFDQDDNGYRSSSGSGTEGTEGGYAGSASSNEMVLGRQAESCSSQSGSSSEDFPSGVCGGCRKKKRQRLNSKPRNRNDEASSSSDIADFSSGSSETADDDDMRREFDFKNYPSALSPPLSSSTDDPSDDLEQSYLSAKRAADTEHERMLQMITRKRKDSSAADSMKKSVTNPTTGKRRLTVKNVNGRPLILTVGSDIMAHVLTFLHPPEILEILTMPLSKDWRKHFMQQPELWRVLCLVEPFKASIECESFSSDDDRSTTSSSNEDDECSSTSGDSFCSLRTSNEDIKRQQVDKFRHLYTSFVRCMKYLSQIRDDAINGRSPSYIDYGGGGAVTSASTDNRDTSGKGDATGKRKASCSPTPPSITGNSKDLQNFLAQARDVVMKSSTVNVVVAARVAAISRKARKRDLMG